MLHLHNNFQINAAMQKTHGANASFFVVILPRCLCLPRLLDGRGGRGFKIWIRRMP
jgi:hypothetical protein